MLAIHICTFELTTASKFLFRPNGTEENHLQNVHTDKTCLFAAGLRKGCKAFVTDRSRSCFTHACEQSLNSSYELLAQNNADRGAGQGVLLSESSKPNKLLERQTIILYQLCELLKLADT